MQSLKVGWIHFKGRQLYQIDCYPFEMEDGVYSKRKEIAPRLFRRDFVCSEATRKSPLLKMAEHLPGVLSPLYGLSNCVFCHVNESNAKLIDLKYRNSSIRFAHTQSTSITIHFI